MYLIPPFLTPFLHPIKPPLMVLPRTSHKLPAPPPFHGQWSNHVSQWPFPPVAQSCKTVTRQWHSAADLFTTPDQHIHCHKCAKELDHYLYCYKTPLASMDLNNCGWLPVVQMASRMQMEGLDDATGNYFQFASITSGDIWERQEVTRGMWRWWVDDGCEQEVDFHHLLKAFRDGWRPRM